MCEKSIILEPMTTSMHDFQSLYQENLDSIYRYVYSKVGRSEDAEDLTSQIFLKAFRSIHMERNDLSIRKWLFQVARTTIADYWREYYRLTISSLEMLLVSGWESSIQREVAERTTNAEERVQRLLQALPQHYREVLICRFLLHLSVSETALNLGLSESNVKVLQFRALKRAADLEEPNA